LSTTVQDTSLEDTVALFIAAGVKDPVQAAALALAFQQSGITDRSKIALFADIGVPDANWMKLVNDSGINDAYLGRMLYYAGKPWTPELLAGVVSAVAGMP